jgi:hypothetical protein
MRQSTKCLAAGAGLVVIGGGILSGYWWPREGEAPVSADPAVNAVIDQAKQCRMTPIPPMNELTDTITGIGESISQDIDRYSQADPPPGVTREQLAAEAKTSIDEQRARLDELIADALDRVAGKSESLHTTYVVLRRCE